MREQARRAGVQNASYETGDGAGGRGDGSGGDGAGRGRTGAGGSAGDIGRAVRRQRQDGGDYAPHGIQATGGAGTPKGNEAALAKQAYDYWRGQGANNDQTLSVLGNQRGENPLGSLTHGDGGSANGQFQWHNDRRADILRNTGIDVATAGFLDQQKAACWEMENGVGGGRMWNTLKNAKTRADAVWALVHKFERSGDQPGDAAIRLGLANRYGRLGLDKDNTAVAGPVAPPKINLPPVAPYTIAPRANIHIPNVYSGRESSEYPAPGEVSGSHIPGALAKHGAELRKMFGERGPQRAPMIERPPLPGQQDVSLRPGDLSRLTEKRNRHEPGSLLRAADQRQAAASAKHEITGSASLRIKLASGLVPDGGTKTKGNLFKEIRLDRAPQPLASTMG